LNGLRTKGGVRGVRLVTKGMTVRLVTKGNDCETRYQRD
jgi:hypothetical protein